MPRQPARHDDDMPAGVIRGVSRWSVVLGAVADIARVDSLAHDANEVPLTLIDCHIHAPKLARLWCGLLVDIWRGQAGNRAPSVERGKAK